MGINHIQKFRKRLSLAAIDLFESPWGAALISGIIYMVVSAYYGHLFKQSDYAYFNYLADSLLHGQTWLKEIPSLTKDLSIYNGKYFLYWPPFPAILMVPFIAVFGIQFNDVIFTILIGAINIGLLAQLLRSACRIDFLHLSKVQRAILVFFFAFGTVHFTLPPFGKVWMTASLVGFTCVLLAYLFAFTLKGSKAWFFTGLALSAAMLTRSNLIFTGIFPFLYILYQQKPWKRLAVLVKIALGILPLIITLTFYFFYNQIRFGDPFETGLTYHNMSAFFQSDYSRYGLFNIHYVPINLYYQYIFYPFPLRTESLMGGSLFLLSPLFLGLFNSFRKPRSKILVLALLASILFTNIPILFLMGTGWTQFGPRYTLDFTVPLLLLTALGIEKWKSQTLCFLTLASVVQYFIGVKIAQ
jgi:hypothetical protein